ncbi:type II secretion system protein GspL [Yersinia ruckeri]|uniref:type II secretion system protein GspL n=1 Tax=Yersinia ruckeri TaxID=29486 RepID=UPI0020C0FBAE|nr:type II secretion system protein GspL [Yersinia ruckeri]EKN4182928.1 type II secretion system protein GspL [Yersinia ruckeri]MCK8555709.1 type II secretion system protein GspL [Yersinia ruckeri]
MKNMLLNNNKKITNELFIAFDSQAGQPIHWHHRPRQGDSQEGELADETALHELQPLAATSQITLLIPAKSVLFHTVTFNGKYRRQHLSALAWQLETFCPGDVEQLHLTVLHRQGAQFALAAVDKNLLQQWLDWLQNAGLRATKALPDVLALPSPSAGWTAARLKNTWLIRQSAEQGFSADEQELDCILGRYATLPNILTYSPRPDNESTWLQKTVQPIWSLLAEGAQKSPINLLQGDFSPPRPPQSRRNKLPIALAAIYLLTFAIQPILNGYRIQQQADQIQAQTRQLYLKNFPDAVMPTSWIQGIAQQMSQLEKGITPPGLLAQLRAMIPLLQPLKEAKTNTLEWHEKTLTLTFKLTEQELLSRLPRQYSQELGIAIQALDRQNTMLSVKGIHHDDKD